MKFGRLIAGASLLGASAWLAPVVAESMGSEQIWGPITVLGSICFIAGFIFHSGLGGS